MSVVGGLGMFRSSENGALNVIVNTLETGARPIQTRRGKLNETGKSDDVRSVVTSTTLSAVGSERAT